LAEDQQHGTVRAVAAQMRRNRLRGLRDVLQWRQVHPEPESESAAFTVRGDGDERLGRRESEEGGHRRQQVSDVVGDVDGRGLIGGSAHGSTVGSSSRCPPEVTGRLWTMPAVWPYLWRAGRHNGAMRSTPSIMHLDLDA